MCLELPLLVHQENSVVIEAHSYNLNTIVKGQQPSYFWVQTVETAPQTNRAETTVNKVKQQFLRGPKQGFIKLYQELKWNFYTFLRRLVFFFQSAIAKMCLNEGRFGDIFSFLYREYVQKDSRQRPKSTALGFQRQIIIP